MRQAGSDAAFRLAANFRGQRKFTLLAQSRPRVPDMFETSALSHRSCDWDACIQKNWKSSILVCTLGSGACVSKPVVRSTSVLYLWYRRLVLFAGLRCQHLLCCGASTSPRATSWLEPAVDKGLRLQPTHLVLMPHMVPIGRVNPGTSVPKTKGIYILEVEGCLAPDCQIVACLLFCPNYSPLLQPLSFGAGKEKAEGQQVILSPRQPPNAGCQSNRA